jgi:two-component system, sensor histidine kinase
MVLGPGLSRPRGFAFRAARLRIGAVTVFATHSAQAEPAPPWLEQVRQEQIATLYRSIYLGISATWLAALVMVWLLHSEGVVSALTLSVWFGLVTLLTLSRVVLAWFYRRADDARTNWRKWGGWFTAGATSSGIVWGIGSVFLMNHDRFDLQLLVIILLSAVVYGSLAAFGRWMPAFFGFFLPSMAPSVIWSFAQGDVLHIAYGVLAAIWIPAMSVLALRFYGSAVEALKLGFENAALAEDLRRQKQRAEDANAAKTRFLAAASHDLRQPVHALGLFVGALRNEKLDAPSARLAEQIDSATASLDELFTSLLDVSRLDAGVVAPRLTAIEVRPMLERVVGELRPAAEAKDLALRVHARDVWVESDPVMLERVVRNLLTNAVRYTGSGGVLAAVRERDGQASIEVWDTGPGIPEHLHEEVFREFYQANRDQGEGGLGLGLAIVQRLCALLRHSLELRSRPGRGTMFRVRATLARPHAVQDQAPEAPLTVSAPAHIWVIDDEAAPREGMRALLTSWGHDVRVAASSAEVKAVFAGDRRRPSVILCDYRLAGENGVAVIAELRTLLGGDTPAALITGDTAPARLREAAESGLPILHKPVSNAKLRALIGNLTRAGVAVS